MIKYSLLLSILLFNLVQITAQKKSLQLEYNTNMLNPAYAGSHKTIDISISRTWDYIHLLDFKSPKNSPRYITANIHSPIAKGFGVGLSYYYNTINVFKENKTNLDFSYKFSVSENSFLSFGLKGIIYISNKLEIQECGNETENPNLSSVVKNNLGLGVSFNSQKFYTGLSFINLVKKKNILGELEYISHPEIYLYSGYLLDLSSTIKWKPSIMIYGVKGAPVSLFVTNNFYFENVLDVGLSYNIGGNFNIVLNTPEFSNLFQVGFALEFLEKNLVNESYNNISLFTRFNIDAFGNKKGKEYF